MCQHAMRLVPHPTLPIEIREISRISTFQEPESLCHVRRSIMTDPNWRGTHVNFVLLTNAGWTRTRQQMTITSQNHQAHSSRATALLNGRFEWPRIQETWNQCNCKVHSIAMQVGPRDSADFLVPIPHAVLCNPWASAQPRRLIRNQLSTSEQDREVYGYA